MSSSLIRITAKLETSDHDGYCSADDCEYSSTLVVHDYCIPNDEITAAAAASSLYAKYLPAPKIHDGGSYYCGLHPRCVLAGLGKHDYRYTVISAEHVCGYDSDGIAAADPEEHDEELLHAIRLAERLAETTQAIRDAGAGLRLARNKNDPFKAEVYENTLVEMRRRKAVLQQQQQQIVEKNV